MSSYNPTIEPTVITDRGTPSQANLPLAKPRTKTAIDRRRFTTRSNHVFNDIPPIRIKINTLCRCPPGWAAPRRGGASNDHVMMRYEVMIPYETFNVPLNGAIILG